MYLLIIKYQNSAYEEIMRTLHPMKTELKNRNVTGDYSELTYEVRFTEDNTSFVTALSQIEGVKNAALVEFTGDFGE